MALYPRYLNSMQRGPDRDTFVELHGYVGLDDIFRNLVFSQRCPTVAQRVRRSISNGYTFTSSFSDVIQQSVTSSLGNGLSGSLPYGCSIL
jgi:hypothetical protein